MPAPRLQLSSSPPKKERRSRRSSLFGATAFLAALSMGVMCVLTSRRQLSPFSSSYMTTPVISTAAEPGIVWLMSFPNRYVGRRVLKSPISPPVLRCLSQEQYSSTLLTDDHYCLSMIQQTTVAQPLLLIWHEKHRIAQQPRTMVRKTRMVHPAFRSCPVPVARTAPGCIGFPTSRRGLLVPVLFHGCS